MKLNRVTIFVFMLVMRTIANYVASDLFDDLCLAISLSYASGLISRTYLLPDAKMRVAHSHRVHIRQT